MAKDKKDKQDKGAKDKGKKRKGVAKPVKAAARKLHDWSQNPMVAQVVAAALVAAAAALKDPRKAQRLAAEAGDEIGKLSKKGAERGNALWQMALDVGRRSLEELADAGAPAKPARKPAKAPKRNSRSKRAG